MTARQTVTFQEAMDILESLPEYQQKDLIDILQRRLIERRREELVKNIRAAKAEYSKGLVKTGSVKDLMKDLS